MKRKGERGSEGGKKREADAEAAREIIFMTCTMPCTCTFSLSSLDDGAKCFW